MAPTADAKVMKALNNEMNSNEIHRLLQEHLQKPGKVGIFHAALSKFVINEHLHFSVTWSWWAFFCLGFYFLYRKIYLIGIIAIFIPLLAGLIPMLGIVLAVIVWILCGISAKYLYCKKFIKDLSLSGYPDKPIDEVAMNISRFGGYNTWAIIVGIIYYIVLSVVFITSIGILLAI